MKMHVPAETHLQPTVAIFTEFTQCLSQVTHRQIPWWTLISAITDTSSFLPVVEHSAEILLNTDFPRGLQMISFGSCAPMIFKTQSCQHEIKVNCL